MFDETKYILSYGSADNAILKFTTAPRNVRLLLTPPVNCVVSDALVHVEPNVQQTVLQLVDVVAATDALTLFTAERHPIFCNRVD